MICAHILVMPSSICKVFYGGGLNACIKTDVQASQIHKQRSDSVNQLLNVLFDSSNKSG